MTPDEQARYNLLKLMTPDTAKFAIQLGAELSDRDALALEWLQLNRWITLIDVSTISAAPGVFRIFLASEEAASWFRKMSN